MSVLRRNKTHTKSHLGVDPATIGGSTEDLSLTPEGNFYDVGGYKPVLKRINMGPKRLDELAKMLAERAAIEKEYAKKLNGFADHWEERLGSKLYEHYTLRDAWIAILTETRQIAQIHYNLKGELTDPFKERVDDFKKGHYPKSMIHYKPWKRANSAFEKGQASWAKAKGKIDKHRDNIAKQEEVLQSLLAQESASGASQKIDSARDKANNSKKKSEAKMRARVDDVIHNLGPKYRRAMEVEFNQCQAEEGQRIEFVKETLRLYHEKADIMQQLQQAHAKLLDAINAINVPNDLSRFSQDFGVDMPMLVPNENGQWLLEGTNEFYGGKGSMASLSSAPPPPVTANITQPPPEPKPVDPVPPPPGPAATMVAAPPSIAVAEVGGPPPPPPMPAAEPAAQDPSTSPPGTKLTALYDYEAQNSDELSFEYDDVIILENDPNVEAGWLCGRLEGSGERGIFPANYVEVDA